jgi:ABC-type nitrate/sulfonate/bicarbonate transport system permease component
MPLAIGLRSVPIIAMTPLLVLIFGRGLAVTLAISALLTFFTTLVNVVHGLRSTSPQIIELMRSFDASRWMVLRKVMLFSALPALFASARVSAMGAMLGAIVGEWLATGAGLGQVMIIASVKSEYDVLWAAGALLTLVSAAVYAALAALERAVLSRYAPEQVMA